MSNMLRQKLFVFGVISFAVHITAAVAESANWRRFYVPRGVRLDCNGDEGSPLCHRIGSSIDRGIEKSEKWRNATTEYEKSQHAETTVFDEGNDARERTDETAIDEARGKKGKKKGLLKVFFVMAAAAKATLLYAMIHAVALIAGKALLVAKVALVLAATVALKKALEHNDKTSVEIVKHPQHSYSQSHSASVDYDPHGGYEGGHRRRRRHLR